MCGIARATVKERYIIPEEATPLPADGEGLSRTGDVEPEADPSSSEPDGHMLVVEAVYCSVCKMWLPEEDQYMEHKRSKKHIKNTMQALADYEEVD